MLSKSAGGFAGGVFGEGAHLDGDVEVLAIVDGFFRPAEAVRPADQYGSIGPLRFQPFGQSLGLWIQTTDYRDADDIRLKATDLF